MAGNEKEAASSSALEDHLRQHPKDAHKIWEMVKAYVDTKFPRYVALASPIDLSGSMTWNDSAWHDLSLAAYVPSTVFKIRVQVVATADVVSFDVRLRPNGSSLSDGEERSFWEVVDAADANMQARKLADRIECSMVDQTAEYYAGKSGGTIAVYLIGYWKLGL